MAIKPLLTWGGGIPLYLGPVHWWTPAIFNQDIQLNIKSERGQELQTIVESLHDFTSEDRIFSFGQQRFLVVGLVVVWP